MCPFKSCKQGMKAVVRDSLPNGCHKLTQMMQIMPTLVQVSTCLHL